MGKLYKLTYYLLGLLCAAAFAFPALAADRVSVTIDANTGTVTTNSQTYRYPSGSTIQSAPFNQVVTAQSGGLQAETRGTLRYVEGSRYAQTGYAPTTFANKFFASTSALRTAAGRCLTSFRCNIALQAGATGLNSFMDGLDWVMGEGAQPQLAKTHYAVPSQMPPSSVPVDMTMGVRNQAGESACSSGSNAHGETIVSRYYAPEPWNVGCASCARTFSNANGTYHLSGYDGNRCQLSLTQVPVDDSWAGGYKKAVTAKELADALPSYNPVPEDFPYLSGGIDPSDEGITIEGDFIHLPDPIVTNEPQSDGSTKRTTSTLEPEFLDNPSKQPEIRFNESTEITIFNEFGDIVSSSTTTTTSSGGGGGGIDIPTDCEFMPTVCRFIDWFTEPDPEMLNEPDLKQLMETFDPDESSYDFGPENASCPEPYVISFSLFPSVEVSYQPVCDVADMVRPLVIALAYIFSGILLVRNI